ncbi:MAG: hypothetical protein P1U87_06035 [Verrucomicrobiales bacterium]|nr:hypothetical protein [Verrucomicrobiales bacterium]
MTSDRNHLIREKKFRPVDAISRKKGHHYGATLTDDHTLFLLNQQRDRRSKKENRSWISRLFRR